MKRIVLCLFMLGFLSPLHSVFAATAPDPVSYPVLSRGHIQDLGDYPQDGSWVESPNLIGTVGESKRIEGFEIKSGASLPAGIEIRYNVHVQNIGWLYDENDLSTWAKDGDYAGTRTQGLRIEAIKIVLTDTAGKAITGYHIKYRGHVQNVGDLPEDSTQWIQDGNQLGTVGSSLRLEALKLEITKADAPGTDPTQTKRYDQAGTFGPQTGNETIAQDVIIAADGVTLQNLTINGNLTIDEAVGDGNVTLNNITVTGETRVRGGGKNSIHINGGKYGEIFVEKTPTGAVRIVATDISGTKVVLSENATGETIILEGAFASVQVNSPDATVETRGQTSIQELNVLPAASNSTLNLGSQTSVATLSLQAPAHVTGDGDIQKAEVDSDSVVFDKAPQNYTVAPAVDIPPVLPAPPSSGGGGSYTPSKIALTITDPTVTLSRIYDGTSAATITSYGTLSGAQSGDDVQVTATAAYDSKNVGTGKNITVTYALTGADASKYTAPANKTVTGGEIAKMQLTAAAPTVSKVYDGNTTTTAVTSVSGSVVGDTVAVSCTATFIDANVGTAKSANLIYSLTGTDAGNYLKPIDASINTGVITAKPLTITGTTINGTKTYDGDTTAAAVATGTLSGIVSSDNVTVLGTGVYDAADAGSRTIRVSYTLDGTAKGNYLPPVNDNLGGTINQRQLTDATVYSAIAKVYDGSTAATLSQSQSIAGGCGSDMVTVNRTATYNSKNASASKTVTVSYTLDGTGKAANYIAPVQQTITGCTITPTPLNVIGTTITPTREYNGTNSADYSIGTVNGIVGSDNVAVAAAAAYDTKAVGTGKTVNLSYTLTGGDAGNYSKPADMSISNGEISPKTLTVSNPDIKTPRLYDGTSKVYNTNGAEISFFPVEASTITGIVGSESIMVIPTVTGSGKDVGTSAVTISYSISGNDWANYQIPAKTVSVTINPIQLTVGTAPTVSTEKTYDGNATATITDPGTVSGILPGDTGVTVTPVASYTDKNAGTNKTIQVSFIKTGDVNNNYSVPQTYDYSTTAKITQKSLGVFDNASIETLRKESAGDTSAKVNSAPTIDQSGIIAGDTVTIALADCHANYINNVPPYQAIAAPGDYNIRLTYSLSGTDAGNYAALGYADTLGHIIAQGTVLKAWSSENIWRVNYNFTANNLASGYTIFAKDGTTVASTTVYAADTAGTVIQSVDGVTWSFNSSYSNLGSDYHVFDTDGTDIYTINSNYSEILKYLNNQPNTTINFNSPVAIPANYKMKYLDTGHLIIYDCSTGAVSDYNITAMTYTPLNTFPALPTGFTNCYLGYEGGQLTLFAY